MRLTTKGRYAVTAMIDIALHRSSGPVSVTDVADRQAISSAYLEQLFSKLKRAGLLQSVRGPGGGYALARPINEVTVSDIIAAVGEGVDATRCHGAADCHDGAMCLTHDLWSALSTHIDQFLKSVTLDTLLAERDLPQGVGRHEGQLIQARHL